jgi:hypothetical protein
MLERLALSFDDSNSLRWLNAEDLWRWLPRFYNLNEVVI